VHRRQLANGFISRRRSAAYAPNEGCLCCLQIVSGVILTALLGIAIGVPLAISLHSASNDTELTSTTGASKNR